MSKNDLNVNGIIRKLNLVGDGQSGETKGKKQERYLRSLIEGKKKGQQIEILKSLYPDHPVWKEAGVSVERLPVK